ncbi:hypothetical protein ABMA27_003136 [Loxostege sticticalis]
MSAKNIPGDKINLRLILVSGKTKEFVFSPVDSAGDIAIHVYDNWPEADWASECVSRAEILRLIYQGRFLHSSVTLGALGLPLGRTTVMHLVPREHLPEPNSHGECVPHGDPAADLPGAVPAQLRDPRRARPAARPHHRHAPRAARAPARAQLAR